MKETTTSSRQERPFCGLLVTAQCHLGIAENSEVKPQGEGGQQGLGHNSKHTSPTPLSKLGPPLSYGGRTEAWT